MVTIDLKYALLCLVFLALIVLIVVLVIVAVHLITTVKELNRVLEDTKVVTNVAQERVTQVDGIVDDLGIALGDVSDAMKGNQNLIGAVTNIAKAASSTASYFKSPSQDDFYAKEARKERTKR